MSAAKPADVRIEITPHGKYKDWIVGYTPTGVIPKQFSARVERPDWPIVVVYILVDREGRAQCDRLTFERRSEDDPGILAKDIDEIPIAKVIQWVIGESLGYFALHPAGGPFGWTQGIPGTGLPNERTKAGLRYQREASLGRPKVPPAKRRVVLDLWAQAEADKWPNAADKIAREVRLSRSKVYEIRAEERRRKGA